MGVYLVLGPVIEVIEEDASQAAALVAVLAQEVVVRPLLELGVVGRVMVVADTLQPDQYTSNPAATRFWNTSYWSTLRRNACQVTTWHAYCRTLSARFAAHYCENHLVCPMEVPHVLLIKIGGSDIGASTKPPLPWDAVPFLKAGRCIHQSTFSQMAFSQNE